MPKKLTIEQVAALYCYFKNINYNDVFTYSADIMYQEELIENVPTTIIQIHQVWSESKKHHDIYTYSVSEIRRSVRASINGRIRGLNTKIKKNEEAFQLANLKLEDHIPMLYWLDVKGLKAAVIHLENIRFLI